MYGTHDLQAVLRTQAQLRRESAEARLAARATKPDQPKPEARRVFGLRGLRLHFA